MLYSIIEVSKILGLSKSRVNKARKNLSLGVRVGNSYGLTKRDIEKIRERIGKRGRPSG